MGNAIIAKIKLGIALTKQEYAYYMLYLAHKMNNKTEQEGK